MVPLPPPSGGHSRPHPQPQDLPQQTQTQPDLTPKAFTGARSAPVGAAEGRAYAFGVKPDDSVAGGGFRGGFC